MRELTLWVKENRHKNVKSNTFWVLNTGATDHVTYLRNIFIRLRKIKHLKINLTNGMFIQAKYKGNVCLMEILFITYLHLP